MADVPETAQRPKRVLISYAQESDDHRARIRKLADQLRAHGIDAMIDQYEPHPPEGWPLWMERQIEHADFVLVVCTEIYRQRADGTEQPGRGLGVAWEADLIREELYRSAHRNERFIPVVFDAGHQRVIMKKLADATFYVLNEHELDATSNDNGYVKLYRHLTGQPLVVKPELGRPIKLDAINAPVAASLVEFATQTPSQPTSNTTAPKPASMGTVLVTEATADMKPFADDFTRFLRESGFDVLVQPTYSIERDVRSELGQAIEQAKLVVQVLGPVPFAKSVFLKPTRVEQWIADKATNNRTTPLRLLSWRSPTTNVSLIADDDYAQLVESVTTCDPELFKKTMLDRLATLTAKEPASGRTLFVHYHSTDLASAKALVSQAEAVAEDELSEELEVFRIDESRDAAVAIGDDPVHGLLVVYGQCDDKWVEEHAKTLKKVSNAANLKYKLGKPPGAIVKANVERPPLRRVPGDWDEFAATEPQKLEHFVATVCGKEVQS